MSDLKGNKFNPSLEHGSQNALTNSQPFTISPFSVFGNDDIRWSIYSNILFFVGGVIELIATIWCYAMLNSNLTDMGFRKRVFYESLWILSPVVYLINSIIDVKWALRRWRNRIEIQFTTRMAKGECEQTKSSEMRDCSEDMKLNFDAISTIYNTSNSNQGHLQIIDHKELQPQKQQQQRPLEINDSPSSILHHTQSQQLSNAIKPQEFKLNNIQRHSIKSVDDNRFTHTGHRHELLAASTFGIAAALSVTAAIFYFVSTKETFSLVGNSLTIMVDSNTLVRWAESLDKTSTFAYSLSAVFVLFRNPWKKSVETEKTNSKTLVIGANVAPLKFQWKNVLRVTKLFHHFDSFEKIGDFLFGVASLIDLMLAMSSLDDDVLWWPILSALLWTLDSFFYLRGDYVTVCIRNQSLNSQGVCDDEKIDIGLSNADDDYYQDVVSAVQDFELMMMGDKTNGFTNLEGKETVNSIC